MQTSCEEISSLNQEVREAQPFSLAKADNIMRLEIENHRPVGTSGLLPWAPPPQWEPSVTCSGSRDLFGPNGPRIRSPGIDPKPCNIQQGTVQQRNTNKNPETRNNSTTQGINE